MDYIWWCSPPVVGKWRIPWNFRVWRGKGTPSPAQLGLQGKRLPESLKLNFQVMILADTAFGSAEFLHGIRKLKLHAITGIPVDRKLVDGRVLRHLHQQGQQVHLVGLKFPVTVSWYYLKREKGRLEKRFVLSTRPLKARAILNGGESVDGFLRVGLKLQNIVLACTVLVKVLC